MKSLQALMLIAPILLGACDEAPPKRERQTAPAESARAAGATTQPIEQPTAQAHADVIVVGAGIGGLSAAYELALGGARVQVVDMFSVFGGHAVMAHGSLLIVQTPMQEQAGVEDSPGLALKDMLEWGEDTNPIWAKAYAEGSRVEIYDWLTQLGVTFESLWWLPGNSVKRIHVVSEQGLGLASAVFKKDMTFENITFNYNQRLDSLIVEHGRTAGVKLTHLRTREQKELRAPAVVLATGGYESNLELVRKHWPSQVVPKKILRGSGVNSQGSGLDLARNVGAKIANLDHQHNYPNGLIDPRYPRESNRGLNALNMLAIWVNAEGRRFVNECQWNKHTFPATMKQKDQTFWMVFDEDDREKFFVSGSGWPPEKVKQDVIDNPELVTRAASLKALAKKTGMPSDVFAKTIADYNKMVRTGVDTEFQKFGAGGPKVGEKDMFPCFHPFTEISKPPFYAVQFYPMSRKSLGGIQVDGGGRVLNEANQPIPGLYAAGEVTGFGGLNGKYGLEGTFLAPSIFMGKYAGRTILKELKARLPLGKGAQQRPPAKPASAPAVPSAADMPCATCHDIGQLVRERRDGYYHFEEVHKRVLEKKYDCSHCHSDLTPFNPLAHKIDRVLLLEACVNCHGRQRAR